MTLSSMFFGIVIAIVCFLPVFAIFSLVVWLIKRKSKRVFEYVPEFIWLLAFSIAGAALFHWSGPHWFSNQPQILESMSLGTGALANLGIVLVVLIAGAQAHRDFKLFTQNVRALLWPTTVGAFGVLLGATITASALRLTVLKSSSSDPGVWEDVWHGAVANANGWIGDSTTFYPTISVLVGGDEKQAANSSTSKEVKFVPAAIVLDTAFGLLWFLLITHVASRYRIQGTSSSAPVAQSSQPKEPIGLMGMVAFCVTGVVLATGLQILGSQAWRHSPWRPPIAICIYLLAFLTGYMFWKLHTRFTSKVARKHILLIAIGFYGLKYGMSFTLSEAQDELWLLGYLAVIAIGAFVGHILALSLLRRRPRELLLVASMCSIGGLASAPQIAQYCADELVEPSYAVALWSNLISLSCILMAVMLSSI